jgi:ubiquinone biosynthesis protein COQ4
MLAALKNNSRLRPLEAIRATRILMATGDTRQVFVILRAMRGGSGRRNFRRFARSPVGKAILVERRDLLAVLTDHEGLSQLPEGSLGRAYLDFMKFENLSAQGLVDASKDWGNDQVTADVQFFRARMRELHDVTHSVTGYGRDPLGELCLLAFMFRHQGNLGMLMIVALAWHRLSASARKAVGEAWRNGKRAKWFPAQDWERLLINPLEEVRRQLRVGSPELYKVAVS